LKPDQAIRRWLNRTRRGLIGGGADHEPRVLIEGAPRPTFASRPWTPARIARFVIGFLLTAIALFLLYLGFAARLARITPDWSALAAPAAEQSVFAAAESVAAITAREDAYRDGWFLAPTRRVQRIAAFQVGAVRAAATALRALPIRGDDADLEAALAALTTVAEKRGDAAALTEASEALVRLGRSAQTPAGADAHLLLSEAAASSADLAVARLALAASSGRPGPIGASAEDSFFEIRGEAYAWRLLLLGLSAQAPPDVRATLEKPVARASESWRMAADFQPLLVLNGPPGAALAPNHLAELGLRAALAGAASRQLTQAARAAAPPPEKPRRRGR
jgi:hypothetical protein